MPPESITLKRNKTFYFVRWWLTSPKHLKCCTFNTIFRQYNIYLEFSACQHKYKWILCTVKLVLNASFQDFWCTNINNHLHLIYLKNDKYITIKRLKILNTQHKFLALNRYLLSFMTKSYAKIYINVLSDKYKFIIIYLSKINIHLANILLILINALELHKKTRTNSCP